MSTAVYSPAEGDAFAPTDHPADGAGGLAASPEFERDGVCFAAHSSGLLRSDDGGQSWRPAYESLALAAPLATVSVAVSPAFGRDGTVFAGVNGGVLRSTDGGVTWQIVALPEPAPLVTALAVSPSFADDGLVFAGTLEDGVFRSSDRGRSWAAWNFGLLDRNILALAVSPNLPADEAVFAGTGSGLFRSDNGGRSWRELLLPAECAAVLSLAAVAGPAGGPTLLVGTEGEGCFASDDGGERWRRLGDGQLGGAVNAVIAFQSGSAGLELLLLHDDTLVLSRDNGATWAEWRPGGAPAGVATVLAPCGLAAGAPLLAGMDDGALLRL